MELLDLSGAQEVITWFGYMPSFHEAKVMELTLRNATSTLIVHCWHTTNELDESGCFVRNKDACITFSFEDVTNLSLCEFNQRNTISELRLESSAAGFKLVLEQLDGFYGWIESRTISLALKSGKPEENFG